jgi:signal transduction histidine kinase
MIKYIVLFFSILIVSASVFSQTKLIESLFNRSTKTKGIELINIYIELSKELRARNADSSIAFAKKALELSIQGQYKKQEALSRISLSSVYNNKSNYGLSEEQLTLALKIGKELKDKEIIAMANLGFGSVKWPKGKIDEAFNYYFTAAKLFEEANDKKGLSRAYIGISMVYQTQNKLELAEKYAKQAMELNKLTDDTRTRINVLHTLANVLGMRGKLDEALKIDSTGLVLTTSTDNNYFTSMFYDNMANCYMFSNRFDEAEINFRKCILIDSAFDNKKQMADTYLNLGNLYMMQKKFPVAVRHLEHAVRLSRETEYKQGEMQALLLLSDVYKQDGSYEKAFDYLKQSHVVEDSIINIASVNKIAELETVYQAEKTAQQLKVQRYEIQKKNYLLWGFAFIAILLLIAAFNIYNRRQLQNKLAFQDAMMKQQFQASKAVIEAEENERKRIAADLHDGVGQMMSAAKMNLSVFESELSFKNEDQKKSFENVMGLIDESCKEIRNVSHQMMPNALLKSGLASAVKEFIGKLDSRIIKVSLHTEGLNERIDNNIETVLYRVIQECVNNVLKHSGASHLDISLLKDADGISATIEDNGKGFDVPGKQQLEGVGLKNIVSRITFLKGTIDFDSTPGKGTLVAIHVPLT